MFKFLDPSGCTYHDGQCFVYNLPGTGQKYAITRHPRPVQADGKAHGPGRLRLMKTLDVSYAPVHWWPWWAAGISPLGENDEEASFAAVELRRIPTRVFWRALRPPFSWGCEANLRGASLREANLGGANLVRADLRGANLCGANLRKANLFRACLSGASLRAADLCSANLRGVALRGADLSGASLTGAILFGADLHGADLSRAGLRRARYDENTTWPTGYKVPSSAEEQRRDPSW